MYIENQRRMRTMVEGGRTMVEREREAIVTGFKDETDRENADFLYVY